MNSMSSRALMNAGQTPTSEIPVFPLHPSRLARCLWMVLAAGLILPGALLLGIPRTPFLLLAALLVLAILGCILDALRRERRSTLESEALFRAVFENAAVGLAHVSLQGGFLNINQEFCRILGYSREEILQEGLGFQQITLPEDLGADLENIDRVLRGEGDHYALSKRYRHKDGQIVWVNLFVYLLRDREGAPHSFISAVVDIGETKRTEMELRNYRAHLEQLVEARTLELEMRNEQLKSEITERQKTEEAIRHLAFYDGLTQLPNRRFLLDRLQQAIARARRDKSRIALLFIDLDKFKPINDEFGHQTGDWLLQAVARRMSDCLREYDTASRFGGDEFVILLPDLAEQHDALAVAERVRATLEQPFPTEEGPVLQVSASIGIAYFPDHATTERDLLRIGDEAMYQAKRAGRNRVVLLEPKELIWTMADATSLVRLAWEPSYASGNETIDLEHTELFRLGNLVLDLAMRPDAAPAVFKESLNTLLNHVALHFKHEEVILKERGYEHLGDHHACHRVLLDRADQLRRRAETDEISIGALVEFLVMDLIAGHLLREDRDFFPVLKP
jgi:diguanylate cyclase (GGDEF)-like protein/PAS domain S-box-containing protein/hemerythrin-like metal-binding protein